MSTKICKNSQDTNIIHDVIAKINGQGGTEDVPTRFEVEVEVDVEIDGVLSPCVLNSGGLSTLPLLKLHTNTHVTSLCINGLYRN